jgi:PilZ domain
MRETESFSTVDTPDVPDDVIEKRRFPRTREYGAQQLEVSFLGPEGQQETTTATLWDFGEGGLGMESSQSFSSGEEIQITGELHGPDYSMRMKARARVAYSRAVDAEFFRVGVAFVEVSYRRIPAASE